GAVDEIADVPARKRRMAVAENELKADRKSGTDARRNGRRMRSCRRHAQARARDDSAFIAGNDRIVDLGPETEVIGSQNEAGLLHAGTETAAREPEQPGVRGYQPTGSRASSPFR